MRILITNDDGIEAVGIRLLAEWAKKLGEVTVVAPRVEQSGKSHGIEIIHAFEVKEISLLPGVTAYAVDSTPADCVRFGIRGLHQTYDLVLSGINRGFNLGKDIVYSGTVGAIFEASYWNHAAAIAVSTAPDFLESAAEQLDDVYRFVQENRLLEAHSLYNVNIPTQKAKGIHITRQGEAYYSDEFVSLGNGMYKQVGECIPDQAADDLTLDTIAVQNGYISVTPLMVERTDMDVYYKLLNLND